MAIVFGSPEALVILEKMRADKEIIEADVEDCPECGWSTHMDTEYKNCVVSNQTTDIACQMMSGGI